MVTTRVQLTLFALAGLTYSAKFSFHNTVELPCNSEWFKVPPGKRLKRVDIYPS